MAWRHYIEDHDYRKACRTFNLSSNEAGEMSCTNKNVAILKSVQTLVEKNNFYEEIVFWEEEKKILF